MRVAVADELIIDHPAPSRAPASNMLRNDRWRPWPKWTRSRMRSESVSVWPSFSPRRAGCVEVNCSALSDGTSTSRARFSGSRRTRQGLENGQVVVGPPKTDAGRRSISIPPHLVPAVADHLDRFTGRGEDAPLFTGVKGGPLRAFMLHNAWELARAAVGLDHLHFHDLRHSGNTWAATTGASTRELMVRMGHASSLAALRYQHATRDRDRAIPRRCRHSHRRSTLPGRTEGWSQLAQLSSPVR